MAGVVDSGTLNDDAYDARGLGRMIGPRRMQAKSLLVEPDPIMVRKTLSVERLKFVSSVS